MDRRTVSIVGAVIVMGGLFAFAGDLDPPAGPIGPTMHTLDEIYAAVAEPQCCSPRPEDIRTYRVDATEPGPHIIIPKVEGPNGFVLTDVRVASYIRIYQDTGEGPVEILYVSDNEPFKLAMGFPLIAGSTITVMDGAGGYNVTLIGYVY